MRRTLLGSLMIATTSLALGQNYSWSNPAGGNWSNPGNWTGSLRPNATTSGVSVFINTSGFPVPGMSPGTSTELTGTYAINSLQSANPFLIYGNGTTLTIHGTGSAISGQLNGQTYATITGPGNLILNGGVYCLGVQINLQGGVTINGTSEVYQGLQLGPATLTGLINLYGSIVGIENPATPLIAHPITNTGTIRLSDVSSVSNGNFTNAAGAVMEKTTGAGSATICSFNGLMPKFTNYGTVRCTSGTLNVNGYGDQRGYWITSGSGRIGIQGEQTLRGGFYAGNATASLTNGSTLTTASNNGNMIFGGFELSDGSMIANTPITINNLVMSGGRMRGTDTITMEGPATVSGGIFESGTTRFFGATTQWTAGSSRMINNTIEVGGLLTRSGGGEIGSGGILRNLGTFRTTGGGQMMGVNVQNQGNWVVDNASGGGMFITPNGTSGRFDNSGTVDVVGGNFDIGVSGTHTGTWKNAPNTLTRFVGGTHTFGSGSNFVDSRIYISSALADFQTAAVLPNLTLLGTNGTVLKSGEDLVVESVVAPVGGLATLDGDGAITFNSPYNSSAGLGLTGAGGTFFNQGLILTSGGQNTVGRNVTMDGVSNISGQLYGLGSHEVTNLGTLNLSGSGAIISNLYFANVGTLNVSNGNFNLTGSNMFVQGGTLNVNSPFFKLYGNSVHNGNLVTTGNNRLNLDSGIHEFSLGNDSSAGDILINRTGSDPTLVRIAAPTTFRSVQSVAGTKIELAGDLNTDFLDAYGVEFLGNGNAHATGTTNMAYAILGSGVNLHIDGGSASIYQANINGNLNMTGPATRSIESTILGAGSIHNGPGSTVTANGYIDMYPAFHNEGNLNIQSSGIGTSTLWNKLRNTGTLNVSNARLLMLQSPNYVGGAFSGGVWNIGANAEVAVADQITSWSTIVKFIGPGARISTQYGSNALQNLSINDGQMTLTDGNTQSITSNMTLRGSIDTDATSSFTLNGPLTMPQGALLNQGNMTFTGGVTVNSGTVNLGGTVTTPQFSQLGGVTSPGKSGVGQGTINGGLNLGFNSYFALDATGVSAGQFDKFQVNGLTNLGGYLKVRIPSGTTLSAGATMPFITSTTPVQGGFADVPPGFAVTLQGNNANLVTLASVASLTGISGSITLSDFLGDPYGLPLTISFSQGGTPMGSINTTIDESGNYFVQTNLRGTFDVYADTGSWLRRKHVGEVTLTDAGIANVNFVLQNGDVDGSGEVDAVDIDAVIAAFGSTGGGVEDVDGSLEVDAVDIDIVIANFGATDD